MTTPIKNKDKFKNEFLKDERKGNKISGTDLYKMIHEKENPPCQIKDCLYKYRNSYECKFCDGYFCDAHYIFRHSKCIDCYKKSNLKFISIIDIN